MPATSSSARPGGELLDRVVELAGRHEVDRRRGARASRSGSTIACAPTKPIAHARVRLLQRRGGLARRAPARASRCGSRSARTRRARAATSSQREVRRAARRSARCPARARRPGRARSDTRTSGPRGAPGSASPRRRRSRRRTADSGRASFTSDSSAPRAHARHRVIASTRSGASRPPGKSQRARKLTSIARPAKKRTTARRRRAAPSSRAMKARLTARWARASARRAARSVRSTTGRWPASASRWSSVGRVGDVADLVAVDRRAAPPPSAGSAGEVADQPLHLGAGALLAGLAAAEEEDQVGVVEGRRIVEARLRRAHAVALRRSARSRARGGSGVQRKPCASRCCRKSRACFCSSAKWR